MRAVSIPLIACLAVLLVGCSLDWSSSAEASVSTIRGGTDKTPEKKGDAGIDTLTTDGGTKGLDDSGVVLIDAATEEPVEPTASCPTYEEACAGSCGTVFVDGCPVVDCPPCVREPGACTKAATCASVAAACGTVDTGCGIEECENTCPSGVACIENQCCEPEAAVQACIGSCGGSAVNRCGQLVSCVNPCGVFSGGCRAASAPIAATCFCPHAWQGPTCAEKQLPIVSPTSFAFDALSGQGYLVDSGLEAVLQVDVNTGTRFVVSDGDHDGVPYGTGPAFSRPYGLALDASNRRAYVTDLGLSAVVRVDLDTGHRSILSDAEDGGQARGTGPAFTYPRDIVLDLPNQRAFVADAAGALFQVELSNGDRKVVSAADFNGTAYGAGPKIYIPQDLALDAPNRRVLVLGSYGILWVDLTTGDRTLVSTGSKSATAEGTLRGAGPSFDSASSFAVDLDAARAYVGELGSTLFEVDLTTGDRVVLSDDDPSAIPRGKGPGFGLIQGVTFDETFTHLYVLDALRATLMRVHLITGDREPMFDGGVGLGPAFLEPEAMALHHSAGHAYVVDYRLRALLRVDLQSGLRSIVEGLGPALALPKDIAIDESNDVAYVVDSSLRAVLKIALDTGERTVISDDDQNGTKIGLGDRLGTTEGLVLDAARNRVLVIDERPGKLWAVDLTSGDRTILSDATRGAGPAFGRLLSLAMDRVNDAAYVTDSQNQSVWRVNLSTGDRTVLSDADDNATMRGLGPAFVRPQAIALDLNARQAYVADKRSAPDQALVRVDLDTGDRTVLSAVSDGGVRRGNGIGFSNPNGVVLDLEHGHAFVIDSGYDAIIRVDLATGDRAIVSRISY